MKAKREGDMKEAREKNYVVYEYFTRVNHDKFR